ncbi:MAG: ankyrin repeat domain-containing protein [Acidobacteria bacterium]|nr:ankyrin repeat domain-containing protein [Acidobacteriota bacterium]
MSFTANTISTPDAATQAFWRAAETGDVNELVSVLPRVKDINTRNEHGVTALMRAAQHGRLRVVRVLLERGADANITRNDKFTALALAAFFGHTDIVRALMEHGADSQASTRHGTSPHMWATARTFSEVVDELESPAPPVEKSAALAERSAPPMERIMPPVATTAPPAKLVAPVSRAVARAAAGSTVVRRLKDPPEIWDLVHPAPKGFDARSAFVARLSSMRSAFAFRALTVVVLASVCAAVGVWLLRGVQARSNGRTDRQMTPAVVVRTPTTAAANTATTHAPTANAAAPSSVAPSAPVSTSDATHGATPPSVNVGASTTPGPSVDKPVFARRRSLRIYSDRSDEPEKAATNDVSQPVAAPTTKTSPQTRKEPVTTSNNSAPLSPQVIAPAKSATPKPKVIQWP